MNGVAAVSSAPGTPIGDATVPAAVATSTVRVRAGGHDWHVVRVTGDAASTSRAPNRPACLCLHGTGASSHSMLPLAAELAATHDVWVPDLPAHASTRTPRGADLSIEGVAAAARALLAALDARPALLVGHSAGAVVLARYLLDEGRVAPPLASLAGSMLPLGGPAGALFGPLARLAAETGWVARLFARRAAREPGHVRRLLAGTGSAVPSASLDAYRALLSDPEHVAGVLRLMAAWRLDGFARRLPRLGARVHLLGGGADGTIPPAHQRRLARLLPNATLDVFPALGHLLHEEAPGPVARALAGRLAADARPVSPAPPDPPDRRPETTP